MKLYKYLIVIFFLLSLGAAAIGHNNTMWQMPKAAPTVTTVNTRSNTDTTRNPIVDMMADVITKKAATDSTIYLVGNVAFHHNGAIIECDSAARYNNMKMDGFGKVVIYKDSAYIYGDKFSYDGNTNIATIYAPIVKMKRGDVTMYTYNLSFNTKTNVGTFVNGGLMLQQENVMEAINGDFNAKASTLTFKDSVAMRSPDMLIKTDSLTYNMDIETITLLTHTVIWDTTENILIADKGDYDTKNKTYNFTENGYIMTAEQEMWADTMRYFSTMREATMINNVQVNDSVNNTTALSDWAYYNDSLGKAILARQPSIIAVDTAANDTSYIRADTFYINDYLHYQKVAVPIDTLALMDSLRMIIDSSMNDTLKVVAHRILTVKDSLYKILVAEELAIETLRISDSIAMETARMDSLALDSMYIVDMTIDTNYVKLNAQTEDTTNSSKLKDVAMNDSVKILTPIELMRLKVDSIVKEELNVDSTNYANTNTKLDSLESNLFSEAAKDSLDVITEQSLMRGYWNVKMWSEMYQMVTDSMVSYTVDSMTVMYGNPVLWNEQNQLSSEQINIYTKDEVLDWVECIGAPFIAQKMVAPKPVAADSSRYNQAIGKAMYAYFKDGEMDSVLLSGNVMNNYYMEEGGYTAAFAHITCGEMVIFFKDRAIENIRWESSPEWSIFPIETIDPKIPEQLEGFNWQDSIRPKTAWEISPRSVRSTMREHTRGQQRPQWGVEIKLIDYRDKLLMDNSWTDRDDEIKNTPDKFILQGDKLIQETNSIK